MYRFALEQFASVSASSITASSIAGTVNFGGATPGGGEFAYSGLSMQDIKDGKIAVMKIDGFVFTVTTQQAGKADKLAGTAAATQKGGSTEIALPPHGWGIFA